MMAKTMPVTVQLEALQNQQIPYNSMLFFSSNRVLGICCSSFGSEVTSRLQINDTIKCTVIKAKRTISRRLK